MIVARLASSALALALVAGGAGARAAEEGQSPRAGLPHLAAGAPAAAPVWTLDKPGSRVTFRVTAGGQAFDGVVKRFDAQLAFSPTNLKASHAVISLDMASTMTGNPQRDQALPGAAWLFVRRFPRAVFVSRSFQAVGPDRYLLQGDLTLRGVTRPLLAPLTVVQTGERIRFEGQIALDRTLFGVGAGPEAADVAPLVSVAIRLSARKAR